MFTEDTSILKSNKGYHITAGYLFVQAMERYGGNMEENDCWDKFASSGKVEDYLKYRNQAEYQAHNKADGTKASLVFTTKPGDTAACPAKTGCLAIWHGGLD